MSFRPISFYLPSSTEIFILFSENISENIALDNFKIESINNSSPDLSIKGVSILRNSVSIRTSPQNSKTYYKLSFLDTNEQKFSSYSGNSIPNNKESRSLYFVGFFRKNPIKDRAFSRVSKIYNLENSKIKDILDAQFEEIYDSQRSVGETLSDNYIRVSVKDEFRVRTSGSKDILANENAYKIKRVSKNRSNDNLIYEKLDYSKESKIPRHNYISKSKISFQEVAIIDEEISLSSNGNSFDGYILNLRNKNIIKLLFLKIIRNDNKVKCDGEIGTIYDIEKNKYSIKDNSYDLESSLKFDILESNQVLLSQNSIERLNQGDRVIVSYLYKNKGRLLGNILGIYQINRIGSESLPSKSNSFKLKNFPIVDSNGKVSKKNGVSFFKSENDKNTPDEFKVELSYLNKKVPENPGEYIVNYETGEVFVFGLNNDGTGNNSYIAQYTYKRNLENNFDYYIDENDFSLNHSRIDINQDIIIEFNYDDTFSEDDYINLCHKESMAERVGKNISGSFSFRTKNGPITDVFRIYNETTGEVYNPLFSIDNEVFFSGNRSPEFKEVSSDIFKETKVFDENLNVFSKFLNTISHQKITGIFGTNLKITPGIPSELVDKESKDYFLRNNRLDQDINIKLFSNIDKNGLIDTVNVGNFARLFNKNDDITFGLMCLSINLENSQILSSDKGSIGSFVNNSLTLSSSLFKREKIYLGEDIFFSDNGKIKSSLSSFNSKKTIEELSRLRKPGDYSVDYQSGTIFVAVEKNQDFSVGKASYSHGFFKTSGQNLFSISKCTKGDRQFNSFDVKDDGFNVLDLNSSLEIFNESSILSKNNVEVETCKVLNDYTVYVSNNILFVKNISAKENYVNKNLNFLSSNDRVEEKDPSQINKPLSEGGYNMFSSKNHSFSENVIDFKTSSKSMGILDSGTIKFEIFGELQKIFSMQNNLSSEMIFKEDLIFRKSKLYFSRVSYSGDSVLLKISDFSIFDSIDLSDKIVDEKGKLFDIIKIDPLSGYIYFLKKNSNGETYFESNLTYIGLIPEVNYDKEKTTVSFPESSGLSLNQVYTFKYIDSSTPKVGSELGVSYDSGRPVCDYVFVNDNLVVYYEYGRNELDWSTSNALQEGDTYYVSYEYGALRGALKRNFGDLTQIPFFTKSRSVHR